jgi:ParB family chromosome partitioning protein
MPVYDLKIDPPMFAAVKAGAKTFEYRVNDRDYKEGDMITLREYDRGIGEYTGEFVTFTAGFILHGPHYGLPESTCIISITCLRPRQ